MFFAQTVFQAILVVALGTAHGWVFECVYKGFALGVVTLVGVVYRGFGSVVSVLVAFDAIPPPGPFAFLGALVGGL